MGCVCDLWESAPFRSRMTCMVRSALQATGVRIVRPLFYTVHLTRMIYLV